MHNNRWLQTTMRASRLPVIKTLGQFNFTFQPSIKRELNESLMEARAVGNLVRRLRVLVHLALPVDAIRYLPVSQCQC